MERWEQSLASFIKLQRDFPWETYVNVSIEEFDEAWRRLVLDKNYIDAWGLKVTMPREDDRPGRKQYHLRDLNRDLIGVINFSRTEAEKTNFQVTTNGMNDRYVMLVMVTFIGSYLAERNWDQMLEENLGELEKLRGMPKQITATSQEREPAPMLPDQDDIEESPRLEIQIKTTAVHYAHTKKNIKQDAAALQMETSSRSYRKYRDRGWLLSDEEFKKETGATPADYWKNATEP